jgi:hypothetical protein
VEDGRVAEDLRQLVDSGFVWVRYRVGSPEQAFRSARALVDERCLLDGLGELAVVGDFVLPPADGEASREFQTLHFDFRAAA